MPSPTPSRAGGSSQTNHSTPDPRVAEGASTVGAVLATADQHGYDGSMDANLDGTLTCSHCGAASPASNYDVRHVQRLEGASDAADMLMVVAMTCPVCGKSGCAVLGYGPNATERDAATIVDLDTNGAGPLLD